MLKTTLDLLNNFSVLVVEDDSASRTIIKQAIKEYFLAYYEARDGMEGLEIFKKRKVDIIVTDVHLPRINGFEMIKEILYLKPDQPFVIVTAYDSDQNILKSIQTGALSFLRKPINVKSLQTSILLALSRRIQQKQIEIDGGVLLDFSRELIYQNGSPVFLTHISNKIFWLLCYNMNKLVTYEMIEDYAYDGASVNKNTIHAVMLRIKRQLEGIEVENISNSGYVLKSKS